jgi:small GTP-binding protein
MKISLKNKNGLNELLARIESIVNDDKIDLPLNYVYQSPVTKLTVFNGKDSLTFVIIGDSTVGKTCFFNRYFNGSYNETTLNTIGVGKESKIVKIFGEIYKITIWDTAGEERFKSLPRKYYQNAEGIFLLFDVTNEDSFRNVKNWISDVKDNSSKSISPGEDGKPAEISLYLLGNKIDKNGRVISKDEAEKMAHSLGMKYFEISCKYDVNVPEAITGMIYDAISRIDKNTDPKTKKNLELRKSKYNKKKKKNGFC